MIWMERNRDLRRASGSSMNGFRKRQRVTVERDSTDEGVRSEFLDTVNFGDPEPLKKEKEWGFTKRRPVERCTAQQGSGGDGRCRQSESTYSSDEECGEEEDDVRVHHPRHRFPSPSSFSVVNNRRRFRDLTSSPDLRNCADEILGFSVPRRTRSAMARKFPDGLHSRKSPASFGGSSKKKKYPEAKAGFWNCPSDSLASPADIEIEAAEALFDLMQQTHSQSQVRKEPGKLSRDMICNARDDEDEPSAKAKAGGTVLGSIGAVKKQVGIEKDKSLDEGFEESVRGVEPMNKGEVGSPKESETLSYVKANARDIRDPTVTNANHATDSEAKKGTKLEIDLMAPPALPSSPERDDVDQQAVAKDGEGIGKKTSPMALSQMLQENRGFSKQLALEDSKNQLPTSALALAGAINSLHGVLPRGGYMPQLQADYPTDARARYVEFKMSEPRPKRCALHHGIARDIQNHQQLIKSVSSSSTSLVYTSGSQMSNQTPQRHVPGDHLLGDSTILKKSSVSISDAPASVIDYLNNQSLRQQAFYQASANVPLRGPGLTHPIGQLQRMNSTGSSAAHQTASATGNTSLPSNPAERSMNLPHARGVSTVNFNHPVYPTREAASPCVSSLPHSGSHVPNSSSIAFPPFKGASTSVPLFDPSFCPSSCFPLNQDQQLSFPHLSKLPALQNTSSLSQNQLPGLQQKKLDRLFRTSSRSSIEHGRTSSTPTLGVLGSPPANPQAGSVLSQPMNTILTPPLGAGNDPSGRSSMGKADPLPHGLALPFGVNDYAAPVLNFSAASQPSGILQMPPDSVRTTKFSTASGNSMMNRGQLLDFSNTGRADLPSAAPSLTEHQKQQHLQRHYMGQQLEVSSSTANQGASNPTTIPAASFRPGKGEASTLPIMYPLQPKNPLVQQPPQRRHDVGRIQTASSMMVMKGSLRYAGSAGQAATYQGEMEAPPSKKSSSAACRGNVISILS